MINIYINIFFSVKLLKITKLNKKTFQKKFNIKNLKKVKIIIK